MTAMSEQGVSNPKLQFLDGGLATELENRGHDLRHFLWSAKILESSPDEILAVHLDYLKAGSDYISSASYQATVAGFEKLGLRSSQANSLIRLSVELAQQARDTFWQTHIGGSRIKPQVAASVGPYGADLANGAEYTGDYDVGREELLAFHYDRWTLLGTMQPDVMLCETVPSWDEVNVLAELSRDISIPTWISLCCKDEQHLGDGTPIRQVAKFLDGFETMGAIGVNCTSPRFVESLIREISLESSKPIAVYPNSGETYDAESQSWVGERDTGAFADYAAYWQIAGANYIGGCCRTTPDHIRNLRARLG